MHCQTFESQRHRQQQNKHIIRPKIMATLHVKFEEMPTHITLPNDEDWKAARVGPWETFARDRASFKRRIELMEKTISRIFTPLHRDTIYSELYCKQHSWLAHVQLSLIHI